jgi:hypothetical protein
MGFYFPESPKGTTEIALVPRRTLCQQRGFFVPDETRLFSH